MYVENDPIDKIDPEGRSGCSPGLEESCRRTCEARGEIYIDCTPLIDWSDSCGIRLGFCHCESKIDNEERCNALYDADSAVCRRLTGSAVKQICWASASERYGACLAGRPIPPLVTR